MSWWGKWHAIVQSSEGRINLKATCKLDIEEMGLRETIWETIVIWVRKDNV
jgi:hypothetical protein